MLEAVHVGSKPSPAQNKTAMSPCIQTWYSAPGGRVLAEHIFSDCVRASALRVINLRNSPAPWLCAVPLLTPLPAPQLRQPVVLLR